MGTEGPQGLPKRGNFQPYEGTRFTPHPFAIDSARSAFRFSFPRRRTVTDELEAVEKNTPSFNVFLNLYFEKLRPQLQSSDDLGEDERGFSEGVTFVSKMVHEHSLITKYEFPTPLGDPQDLVYTAMAELEEFADTNRIAPLILGGTEVMDIVETSREMLKKIIEDSEYSSLAESALLDSSTFHPNGDAFIVGGTAVLFAYRRALATEQKNKEFEQLFLSGE